MLAVMQAKLAAAGFVAPDRHSFEGMSDAELIAALKEMQAQVEMRGEAAERRAALRVIDGG
jgi:hypothetical protein